MPIETLTPTGALIRMKPTAFTRSTAVTVVGLTGLSEATVRRKVKAGAFPRPVSVGARGVRWRLADVQAWIASLPSVTPDARRGTLW